LPLPAAVDAIDVPGVWLTLPKISSMCADWLIEMPLMFLDRAAPPPDAELVEESLRLPSPCGCIDSSKAMASSIQGCFSKASAPHRFSGSR
jgi:hypothetical protein